MLHKKLKVISCIAIATTALCFFFFYFCGEGDIFVGIGKASIISTVLTTFFNKFLWKWRLLNGWLVDIPNIGGNWRGKLFYSFEGNKFEKEATITIKQTYLETSIKIKTNESWSDSVCCDFVFDSSGNNCQLIYNYYNEPLLSIRDRSQIHYGTAKFVISDDCLSMNGYYWTDRQSQGEMILTKE